MKTITLNEETVNNFAEAVKESILNVFNNNNIDLNDFDEEPIPTKRRKAAKFYINPNTNKEENIIDETPNTTKANVSPAEQISETSLISIINTLKTDKNVSLDWWQQYKKQFKSGDIVYIKDKNKFGIFVQPSTKKNKVRVRLMKHNDKNTVYTVDWMFDVSEMELVKHKSRVSKKFIENDLTFKVK